MIPVLNIDKAIQLNDSFSLKSGQCIQNRLFKSAMSEQLGDSQHNPLPGVAILYQRWDEGGVGLS